MTLSTFLFDVLPASGPYVVAVEASGNRLVNAAAEIEQVAAGHQHNNIYYVPASFAQGGKRSDEHVVHRKAFVLDVDIRSDKADHFHTFVDAQAAVDGLVSSNTLPQYAYMVSSGAGLHVYWLADHDLDLATWRQANDGFLAQVHDYGEPRLMSDAPTSKRASGLFRVPGTFNVKHSAPLACQILADSRVPLSVAWLQHLLDRPRMAPKAQSVPLPTSGPLAAGVPSYMQPRKEYGLGKFHDPTRTDFVKLVQGCKVFAQAVLNPAGLSETGWRDMGRTLKLADDGYERFHEISALDPARYNRADADAKWQHILTGFGNGVRCDTLRGSMCGGDTTLCVGCPQFMQGAGSPINLAKIVPEEPDNNPLPTVKEIGEGDALFQITEPSTAEVPIYLKDGKSKYQINERNELWRRGELNPDADPTSDEDDKWTIKPLKISDRPFWMTRIWGKAEADDKKHENHTDAFAYIDAKGAVRPTELKTGVCYEISRFAKEAAMGGLRLELNRRTSDGLQEYLMYTVREAERAADGRGVTFEQHGWQGETVDDKFVIGDLMYTGNKNAERIKLHGHANYVHKTSRFGTKGSYVEQLKIFRKYGEPGVCPVAQGTILFGLASPLLTFLGEGSFTVMMRGPTGAGKTAMQKLINSFWGFPNPSTITKGDSEVGRLGVLAGCNSVPVCFDEISLDKDDELRDLVLKLSNEQPVAKRNQDGTMREILDKWRLILLASTNRSLMEFIPGGREEDAAARKRVIEIEYGESSIPSTPDWKAWAATFEETVRANYGWLGPVFMDYVITNRKRIRARMAELKQAEMSGKGNYQERFFETAIAAVRMAGEIIEELGWMATTSWTDSMLKQSEINKVENQKRATEEGDETEEQMLPDRLHFNTFLPTMMSRYGKEFGRSIDHGEVPWSPTRREPWGILLEYTQGNALGVEAGEWTLVLKDNFDRYCEKEKATPGHLVKQWRKAGFVVHVDTFDIAALMPEMKGINPPTYYQFKTK